MILLCLSLLVMAGCIEQGTESVDATTSASGTTQTSDVTSSTSATTTITTDTSASDTTTETTTSQPIETTLGAFTETGRVPYAYKNLKANQLKAYNQIIEGVRNNIAPITLNANITASDLEVIFMLIKNFEFTLNHVSNEYEFAVNESTGYVSQVELKYVYLNNEAKLNTAVLNKKVDEIISTMPQTNDYDKIKYFHDYIIKNCVYNLYGDNIHSAYGALIDGEAVCEGYSKAMALLCNSVGIECIIVTGYGDDIPHMWNMLKYNGNWYHMDLTWDDPVDNKGIFDSDYVQYDYFNVTTDQILQNHVIIGNGLFPVPAAYAIEGNYFSKTNSVAKTSDAAAEIIKRELTKAVNDGRTYITFKAATQTVYNDIAQRFFAEKEIFSIIREVNNAMNNPLKSKCAKLENPEGQTFTLFFEYE